MKKLLCLLALLFLLPALSNAQSYQTRESSDYFSDTEYQKMIYQLIDRKKDFNFAVFRDTYSRLSHYDPISKDSQVKMIQLIEAVQAATTAEAKKTALTEYNAFLMKHVANIDVLGVVMMATTQDPQLGDKKWIAWVYKGLLDSIANSGSGQSRNYAYKVITLGEEPTLMEYLKYDILTTDTKEEDTIIYNIHSVKDRKTGKVFNVYVDISKPVTFLKEEIQNQLLGR